MSKHLTKKRNLSPTEEVLKIPKDLPAKSILEIRNDLADFILTNQDKYQEFETDKIDYNGLRTLGAYASNEMKKEPTKKTLEDAKKVAEKNKGECLSTVYINSSTKMLWRCKNNHTWNASYNQVNSKKSWCPACAGCQKNTLEDAKKVAVENKGECLSTDYINAHEHMLWRCKNNHTWNASYNQVSSNGSWCLICSGKQKKTLEDAKKVAEKNEGECLSTVYINSDTHMLWRCKNSHEWNATYDNVTNRGRWCPSCAGVQKKTLEDAKKVAAKNKGECLSTDYINNDTYMLWRCKDNHTWKATYASVNSNKSWCPSCVNKTEQKLYEALSQIYPILETQYKVDWCKNISYLPFDFVLKLLNIIIELDGRQHFIQVSNWKSPEETQKVDLYKMKCANDNGFSVIRIIQEDVYYDIGDWLSDLVTSIKKIVDENIVQNIYLCKNNEYEHYKL